ncbi:MAG TPA: oligosaccharide flippase family protein [Candidatus Saccharimonadales bacterium]|nr:oligosaccharide flippase family protein [Candidatus Saccharimonadales bacterium]
MEELDIAAVTRRSIHGVFALVSRTFFLQLIAFGTNIALTIYLSPIAFGIYTVVTAVIAFLQYFSDIGLAGALIQKKEPITQEDLATTFTIQQTLIFTAVILALCLSPFISNFYHLDQSGTYLLEALIVSFFLSSLKTIPSVILERSLRFEKLVIPQIVEQLVFSVTVLFCAIRGFGVTSFTYAVLARGLFGLVTMYIVAPWMPRIHFSKETAKKLLSFGIPFQLNSFLGLVKDDLFLAFVGKILPFSQVGYIGFAQKWAFTPLRLIMDNIIRITFPSFSRLQNEKEYLGKAVEKSLFTLSLLILPSLVGLVVLAPLFIAIVPKYEKWEPALLSLSFFAINAGFASFSTPLTNALNAIGKIKTTLYLMIFWTAATWIITPIMIMVYGYNGVSIASAIIAVSSIAVIYITKKYINFSVFNFLAIPLLCSLLMGVLIYFCSKILPHTISTVIELIVFGGLFYFISVFLLARREVVADIREIRKHLIK